MQVIYEGIAIRKDGEGVREAGGGKDAKKKGECSGKFPSSA